MKEKEKIIKEKNFEENNKLNMPEFYNKLNRAIMVNNIQSIYQLSKVFARNFFKNIIN